MSTLFSKKFTNTDSVRMEARICSKEMHQSVSTVPPTREVAVGLRDSPPTSTVSSARSSHSPSLGFLPIRVENFFPTSPMRRRRLATVAMAWYKSCSMGSSLNMLYSVLHTFESLFSFFPQMPFSSAGCISDLDCPCFCLSFC
uniref:Uncharacterized protein n=1 Tax=Sciurus vulgaris TaxID=55149 RepID=A0A8D2AYY8_SCIVU